MQTQEKARIFSWALNILFLLTSLVAGFPAYAKYFPEEINPCRYAIAENPPYAAAEVTGDKDEHIVLQNGAYKVMSAEDEQKPCTACLLVNDPPSDNCPSVENPSSCKPKGYLLPGDKVIAAHTDKDFTCVTYEPLICLRNTGCPEERRRDRRSWVWGWVPTRNLKILPPSVPDQWMGIWQHSAIENTLFTIAVTTDPDGVMRAVGKTNWTDFKDHVEYMYHWDFVGTGKPEGDKVTLSFKGQVKAIDTAKGHFVDMPAADETASCTADFTLLDNYLIAHDQGKCKTKFGGIYIKQPAFSNSPDGRESHG